MTTDVRTVTGASGAVTSAAQSSPSSTGSTSSAGTPKATGTPTSSAPTSTTSTGSGSAPSASRGSAPATGKSASRPASKKATLTPKKAAPTPYISGEEYDPPGAMEVSSPEFVRNGTIPSKYTCEGANISPALQWRNLPAHTAELVLFIIDDGSNGPEGGIRWVVAGLEPSLSGIAAGGLPTGAVVGLNTAGKATYGGICPPKGKAVLYQFVLWALSKKLNFSSGFVPAVAEHEYSNSELSSAVTYAIAERQ